MVAEPITGLLESYQKEINSYDEVLDSYGKIKPHWWKLFSTLEKIGLPELQNRNQEIKNKIRENGVTYNVYGSTDGLSQPWQLDTIPFLIEQKEWEHISKGLQQRATLLDLMVRDIYGERKLIKDNILPAELVYGNMGFLRSCQDVKLPSQNQLIMYAADMARGPNGQMWVLDNRTQSPSGSGYALENRYIFSKVLPDMAKGMYVSRLSPFFVQIQQNISKFSRESAANLNVVYLTPGPNNETYFEHAYLASYLGYTLVQGDDLLVKDGYVWIKSIDGLQRVDVIIRRVDDEWCDPLELRDDSQLGVPGLLQAMRLGNVMVVNPPGSSVLENSAFMAFMASASQYFLGEELMLPSVATWWCGQPKELHFVLDNLHRLIIKKANRKQHFRSVYGRTLSKTELEALKKQILANPTEYVAQEEVSFSTTPAFIDSKIEPRYAAIRAFLTVTPTGYQVMDGGLTRSSPIKDRFTFSNQYGGISKDTWIVSEQQEEIREKITLSSPPFIR
ncbi:MAG: circularly permuted type 2 ATP-grasp protein, partial [Siphonobacter sp.]